MTPVIPFSSSKVALFPGTTFVSRKNNRLTRTNSLEKTTKRTLSSQRFLLPVSTSVRIFPTSRSRCAVQHGLRIRILAATGTDIAVEEPDSAFAGEDADGTSEAPPSSVATDEAPPSITDATIAPATQSKRPKPMRKSEMPPVQNEELVPGATFTGKVKSIQPFGAFVDFGAFTDGLVHVSQLSDNFVKDVGSIVSVGQEVKVRLLEANSETGRISLTMRENSNSSKLQQSKDAPAANESVKPRPARKNPTKSNQKSSKFVKGQELEGTVKNLTRAGAFISLPEGEEGFLPTSEESDEGLGNMLGGSALQVGEEVRVRVLRITRGQFTLTMKKEEAEEWNSKLLQGVVHVATNPFVLAFRKNKDIATFLDEKEKVKEPVEASIIPKSSEEIVGKFDQSKTVSDTSEVQDQPASIGEVHVSVSSAVDDVITGDKTSSEEDKEVESLGITVDLAPTELVNTEENPENVVSNSLQSLDSADETIQEEVSSKSLTPEGSVSSVNSVIAEAPVTDGMKEDGNESDPATEVSVDQILSSESVGSSEVEVSQADEAIVKDDMQAHKPSTVDSELPSSSEEDKEVESLGIAVDLAPTELVNTEENPENAVSNSLQSLASTNQTIQEEVSSKRLTPEESVSSVDSVTEEAPLIDGVNEDGNGSDPATEASVDQILSSESVGSSEVKVSQADEAIVKDDMQAYAPSTVDSELPYSTPNKDEKVEPIIEKNGSVNMSSGQADSPSSPDSSTKATISPALVKQLREETGAGMMDCKKALTETGGDLVKAQEFLRKKGLASADKKSSRVTAEGRIGSYIHDSRIGVLIEVNCETDFVSRGDIFKELVDDLAMQVAACPQVRYLVTDDISEEIVKKEKEIEMQKEDLLLKPEQIRSKIVEGRIRKRLEELALLEQPYIKDDKVVVKDWVKQTIATIGENIKVKRFVRYNLGEGLAKKSQDFAAEVAAQTAAKSSPVEPAKDQPVAVEAKEAVEKPPTVTVSAVLVKQLREETGAGMMDCKKALTETGGDLEKAQGYLRKKGLSTADKKSSRVAAEGRIGSYIHDSRIGVLLEVNCETDFVGRSEKFKELVDDLAMQVVACPQVQFVSIEDIPVSIVNKEKELEMQREDLQSKPENIREKIVEGRISKRLGELALLEQPFIKNDSVLVKDLVKQTVAALGENIKVRRFVRFTLGETVEDTKVATEE